MCRVWLLKPEFSFLQLASKNAHSSHVVLSEPFSESCECTHVYICSCIFRKVCVYVCVESKNNLVISSKAVTLVFETGSPSGLELIKEARPCPASLRNLPASVFYFPSPRNTKACHHARFLFCLMWALWLKLRSLCVQGKYFNHWAISQTLSLSLEMTWFSLRVPASLGRQLG